jgi:probable rRNA maturation factor
MMNMTSWIRVMPTGEQRFSIDVQLAVSGNDIPSEEEFIRWATLVLQELDEPGDVTIRVVDEAEIAELNENYRHKPGPTNVLSFPADIPDVIGSKLLGDVVIAAPVVVREAAEQHKPVKAHWAHMVIHGILHLAGYDHAQEQQAAEMEAMESRLLSSLGYADPYSL